MLGNLSACGYMLRLSILNPHILASPADRLRLPRPLCLPPQNGGFELPNQQTVGTVHNRLIRSLDMLSYKWIRLDNVSWIHPSWMTWVTALLREELVIDVFRSLYHIRFSARIPAVRWSLYWKCSSIGNVSSCPTYASSLHAMLLPYCLDEVLLYLGYTIKPGLF